MKLLIRLMPQKRKRILRYQKATQRLIGYNDQQKRLRLAERAKNRRQEEEKARRRIENYGKTEPKRPRGIIASEGEVNEDGQLRGVLR